MTDATTSTDAATETETPAEVTEETVETQASETVDFDWRSEALKGVDSDDAKKFGKQLEKFESIGTMAASYRDMQKQFDNRVAIPGADASDEDKDAFAAKMGWVEDAAKYAEGFERPEFATQLLTEDGAKATEEMFFNAMHEARMPAQYASMAASQYYALMEQQELAKEEQAEVMEKASEAALREDWGKDYDANMQLAKRFAEHVGAEDLLDIRLESGGTIGSLAPLVRAIAAAGRSNFEESQITPATMTTEQRSTLQEEYDGMIAKSGTPEYQTQRFQAKLQAVAEKLFGTDPIAGEPA